MKDDDSIFKVMADASKAGADALEYFLKLIIGCGIILVIFAIGLFCLGVWAIIHWLF